MGNMKAERLHDCLAFFKVYHIIFVNIRGEKFLRVDELLDIGQRLGKPFPGIPGKKGIVDCLPLFIGKRPRLLHVLHPLGKNLNHIVKQSIRRMDRTAVDV